MTTLLICLALLRSDHELDRTQLLRGVSQLVAPRAGPGALNVSGDAFVFATGYQGKGRAPLFAAAQIERGKAVAAGHEAFFSPLALNNPSNARLLGNVLTWLSGKPVSGLKVGLVGYDFLADPLRQAGAVPTILRQSSLRAVLPNLDVVCVTPGSLDGDTPDQIAIMRFVKQGHGVLIAGPGWGWNQLHPTLDLLADDPGNAMLLPYGLSFTNETANADYLPLANDKGLYNTSTAIQSLKAGGLSVEDRTTATYTLKRALNLFPPNAPGLPTEIDNAAALEVGGGAPSPQNPIGLDKPFSRLKVWLDYRRMQGQTLREIKAYPSAGSFPGSVNSSAKRVTSTVVIDTSVQDWHGLGLYAAPGEVIEIDIPEAATTVGFSATIGPHTDTLWENDSWPRFPDISKTQSLSYEQNQMASAFGGTIFISVPAKCKLGKIPIVVKGAVAAARYVRGQTTPQEWKTILENADGPWAEMEGKYVILSLPLSSVRKVQDPAALMAYWDQMMQLCYGFYAAPVRNRPERYCADVEISAGYMHSGYPIMTHIDVADTFCDLAKLRGKGKTWGFYHEMGHNFQQSAWTWDGTGEVTNNLFSLFASEKLNGVTPDTYGDAHTAMTLTRMRDRVEKYIAAGAHYENWKSDPFLALTMFVQLRKQFGWAPFTEIFAEYQEMPIDKWPSEDIDKRSMFMVRFSKLARKNLGPFFTAWGVPTTPAARASVRDLPTWMPTDWPTKN